MKKFFIILIELLVILFVLGCFSGPIEADSVLASPYQSNEIVVAFYSDVKDKNYSSITSYRSEIDLELYSEENLTGYLDFVNITLGDLKSYKVTDASIRNIINLDGHKSTTTFLTINTDYAKGSAVEHIIITTRSGSEQLDGWDIISDKLPKE